MTVRALLLEGFADPALRDGRWDGLLRAGATNVVYLTREWQRTWWDHFSRGQHLLVAAEHAGRIVALAPLYSEQGMVYFCGSGDADYLDVLGHTETPGVLDGILGAAAAATPDFCGFRLFGIPGTSPTGARLQAAAARLGWWCYSRQRSAASRLDLIAGRELALSAANGPRVSKRERYFSRQGPLALRQFTAPGDIALHLDNLFDQHSARWGDAGEASRFADTPHRRFLQDLIARPDAPFRPRLTCLEWQGRFIASEFAWIYEDVYVAVASSFAPDLAPRSPGQVLQRQIVKAAISEGLRAYDFGEGDYPYKLKYVTDTTHVATWELFPIPPPPLSGREGEPC